jgi:hypothetical protein
LLPQPFDDVLRTPHPLPVVISRGDPTTDGGGIHMIIELGTATEETKKYYGFIDFFVDEQPS